MFKKHAVHLKWPLMYSERCRNFDNICSLQLLGIELVCLMFEIFFFFYSRPVDEAGPGPVKSKYDALDFDTLLKEAQKSMHR